MRIGEPTISGDPSLVSYLRKIAVQLNLVSEGAVQGATNAYTAAPTTGTYQRGDFIKNSAPSEAGGAGSKYVITGWICTVAGTPGTWLQVRTLTGN
jgi:hypothetical protein